MFVTLLLAPASLSAQEDPAKGAVDGLIRSLRHEARPDGSLGTGSARSTAQMLAAAGHCHRYYHDQDGPWVRRALAFLITRRTKDGTFADPQDQDPITTTRWVVDALAILSPQRYEDELRVARERLEQLASRGRSGNLGSAFAEVVEQVRRDAAADPKGWSKGIERRIGAAGLVVGSDGKPDLAASVDALVQLVALQVVAREQDRTAPPPGKTPPVPTFSDAQQRGIDFVAKLFQDGPLVIATPQGSFPSTEMTALGLAALQTKPKELRTPEEQQRIERGLAWLGKQQNQDGSFGTSNVNYTTSAAVAAIAAAADPKYADMLQAAQRYTLALQHTEANHFERGDRDYGSIGYGGSERGDLSNTQFALESLRSTGLAPEHEAFQKALLFLQRTQNLKEVNDYDVRTRNPDEAGKPVRMHSGDDGGAAYYPGNSPAGYVELPDGSMHPRSYGSMTYALLKAYTLCGVGREDPRVRAAVGWLAQNWTLTENPGADPRMAPKTRYQGLFYYYMVMAQALDIAGLDQIPAAAPGAAPIDWRRELRAHLERSQRPDGSWVNEENSRWWENMPALCTIYSLLALARC
jgi:squalene-hopene/tetraprenyl-beta-curcumene cyclase